MMNTANWNNRPCAGGGLLGHLLEMTRLILIALALVATSVTACGGDDFPARTVASGATDNGDKPGESDMENTTLRLSVNGRSFTATLAGNTSAEALKARLAQGAVSVRMNDYGDMEKVGELGFTLPRNDRPTTTRPGDLILYQGNSFVIYYDVNTWNFTRLGHVDGVSTRAEMLGLLGGAGEVTVTLSLPGVQDRAE